MSVSSSISLIGSGRSVVPVLLILILCLCNQSLPRESCIDLQTDVYTDSSEARPVEEASVTEDPLLFSQSSIAGNVSVITAEEIEASSALHVGDLLHSFFGSHIGEYGFFGQRVSAGFYGVLDEHVLIMVDGRPVNDPYLGGFDLNQISLEMIERIEVIRGCRSSFFGSDAVGATIHIVTKKKFQERPYTKVRFESGDLGFNRISVLFGKRFRHRHFLSLGFEERKSEGFRVSDEYSGKHIHGVYGYSVSPRLTVTSILHRYQGERELPGAETNPTVGWRQEDERTDLDVILQSKGEKRILHGSLFMSDIQSEGVDSSIFSHENRIYGAQCAGSLHLLPEIRFVFGSRIQRKTIESTIVGKHDTHEGSLFALGTFRPLRRVTLLCSGRYDAFSENEDRFSPGLICGVHIPRVGVASLSLQRGLKAPTLADLFPASGNPNLQLETSHCYRLNFSRREERYEVQGSIFLNTLNDQMLLKNPEHVQDFSPVDSRNKGFEVTAKSNLHRSLSFGATFAYVHSEDMNTHTSLPYRPRTVTTAWLQFSRSFIKKQIHWRLRLEAEHNGEQYSDYDERARMKKYGLLHAKVSCRIHDLNLYVIFRNLTDTSYQSRIGYPMPGRTFRFGGSWELWD